jgi:hypothetical protein
MAKNRFFGWIFVNALAVCFSCVASIASASQEPSFEEVVQSEGASITLNDPEFVTRLDQTTLYPVYVQHGQFFLDSSKIERDAPFCQFGVGERKAISQHPYSVDPASLKKDEQSGTYFIQFSLESVIGVFCGNFSAGQAPLTVSDLKEMFGNLLSVKTSK